MRTLTRDGDVFRGRFRGGLPVRYPGVRGRDAQCEGTTHVQLYTASFPTASFPRLLTCVAWEKQKYCLPHLVTCKLAYLEPAHTAIRCAVHLIPEPVHCVAYLTDTGQWESGVSEFLTMFVVSYIPLVLFS